MPVYDTFEKRAARARNAGIPDIYVHDDLPKKLRFQIVHIIEEIVESLSTISLGTGPEWKWINRNVSKEIGKYGLGKSSDNDATQCAKFIVSANYEQVLSLIEISLGYIDGLTSRRWDGRQILASSISELNQRFQESSVGYQCLESETGLPFQFMRTDSQYLHADAVEPAVSLLHDAGFKGPLEEFMEAHRHYREGNGKAAIVSANNAFESTMKAICDKRGWGYDKDRATAKSLIDTLLGNGLIPSSMQSHFAGLRTTLAGGLPTVRNRMAGAGHGQGAEPVDVPKHIVSYALHLAATNIVFLIELHNASR